jgi:flagellar motor switch protein FliN/FliY
MDAQQPEPTSASPPESAPQEPVAAKAPAPDPLSAAEAAIAQARAKNNAPPTQVNLPDFTPKSTQDKPEGIDLLADVNLNVKIELGRTRMLVEDVLRLGEGSVVELDKLAGDPVDVYVNDRRVARGEVLVLNDNFCVRINEILAPVGREGGA